MRLLRSSMVCNMTIFLAIVSFSKPLSAKEARVIFKATLRSTAWVIQPNGDDAGTGTGWLVSKKDKLLITNRHVVGSHEKVWVVFPEYRNGKVIAERNYYARNGRPIAGKVVHTDQRRDLAVIQLSTVPDGVRELKLASESPDPGEAIHSIGNPGFSGALWVYTHGRVRSVYLDEATKGDKEFNARVVESDAAINPGDSGGPVVNDSGELVGVHRAFVSKGRLISRSIDVSEVKAFLTAVQARKAKE
jgi:serine protease Do